MNDRRQEHKPVSDGWQSNRARTGRAKVTLANWTGVACCIPRTELDKCKGLDVLAQSSVCFLFGTTGETDKNAVYIGQAGIRKNGEGFVVLAGSVIRKELHFNISSCRGL
jgi:hypothetical protein